MDRHRISEAALLDVDHAASACVQQSAREHPALLERGPNSLSIADREISPFFWVHADCITLWAVLQTSEYVIHPTLLPNIHTSFAKASQTLYSPKYHH